MSTFVLFVGGVFGLPKRWFLDALCYKRLTKVTKILHRQKIVCIFVGRLWRVQTAFDEREKPPQGVPTNETRILWSKPNIIQMYI